MQRLLNSLQNGKCSFIFTTLLVHTTNATISTKSRSSTSVNFHYPLWTLLVHKIILAISTDIPFLYISVVFHLPVLVQLSQQSKPKIFSLPQPFRQFRLNQGTNELGSLVRAGNVLIPSFFLKVRAQTHWFLLAQT